jgi:ribosome-associated translation inhibitor RaiA
MNLELRINAALPTILERYIERRLNFALARYGNRVENTSIRICDGSNPGESRCRIVAMLTPFGKVEIEERDVDLFSAIDRASGRLGRRVGRELDRVREARTTRQSIRTAA